MQDRQSNMIAEKREAVKGFLPWQSKRHFCLGKAKGVPWQSKRRATIFIIAFFIDILSALCYNTCIGVMFLVVF